MEFKKFLSIHIFFVLIFVGFVYYVTIFIFLDDLLSLQTSTGKNHSFFYTFLACLVVFSFFVCVVKDPGGVPSSYLPDVEDHEASDQESKRSVSLLFHAVFVLFLVVKIVIFSSFSFSLICVLCFVS